MKTQIETRKELLNLEHLAKNIPPFLYVPFIKLKFLLLSSLKVKALANYNSEQNILNKLKKSTKIQQEQTFIPASR